MNILLALLVALSSAYVALCYVVIGLLVIPNLRLPLSPTILAGLFFLGCALTHTHIAAGVFEGHFPGVAESALMVVLHLLQAIGGTGFIVAVLRKRIVVKLEED